MSECGIDTSKFFGDSVSFGGSSIPPEGQPPPLIKISENIDKAGCSGGSRVISIDISGELVCCDPQESIKNADDLIDAFSESCGDISAGGYSYKGARVNSFDVSSSSFVGKVPYSASLTWTDPDYGDVVVFIPPHVNVPYIKRLIGKPGDTIGYFNKKIYGEKISVEFVKKVRDEIKFDNIYLLHQQLLSDRDKINQLLES